MILKQSKSTLVVFFFYYYFFYNFNRELKRISIKDYIVNGYITNIHSDIQGELEQFLQEKDVQNTISAIVERVLLTEAANPYASILEYLTFYNPEQVYLALELVSPKNTFAANALKEIQAAMDKIDKLAQEDQAKGNSNQQTQEAHHHPPGLDEFSSEEEDNDLDEFNVQEDIETKKEVVGPRGGPRRMSVSSESLDPQKLKDQISQVAIHPKSPEIIQSLFQIISKSSMLRGMLDVEERALIIKALSGPLHMRHGETIIQQGDQGNLFFILETGVVDVFVKKNDKETKVHTYKDGDAFGQLALLYNAPRAATCKATSDVKLWTLDRTSFKVLVAGAAMRKREMYSSFLSQVKLLQSLNELEFMILADSLAEEKYEDHQIICHEGEPGDHFYIVLDGIAECYQHSTDGEGSDKLVATLTKGQYFGEIALLTTKPRQATVKAKGILKVLTIDRPTFIRVLGPLEEELIQGMEEY